MNIELKEEIKKVAAYNRRVGYSESSIVIGILEDEARVYYKSELIGKFYIKRLEERRIRNIEVSNSGNGIVVSIYLGNDMYPNTFLVKDGEGIEVGSYQHRGKIYPSIFESGNLVAINNKKDMEVSIKSLKTGLSDEYTMDWPYYRYKEGPAYSGDMLFVSGFGVLVQDRGSSDETRFLLYRGYTTRVHGVKEDQVIGRTGFILGERDLHIRMRDIIIDEVAWFDRYKGKFESITWVK
jgi:hypothetical protein